MPLPSAKSSAKGGADAGAAAKPKKAAPQELCGCGVDTYRPPPKGKKLNSAPVVHAAGCKYQRTTCDAYPFLPRCEVCQNPCTFCGGKNRWCPHCYDRPCQHRYKRVVHGWEAATADAGPSTAAAAAASAQAALSSGKSSGAAATGGAPANARRSTTVKFVG